MEGSNESESYKIIIYAYAYGRYDKMSDSQKQTYISLLINSLENKINVLDKLEELTVRQDNLLKEEDVDLNVFDEVMFEKEQHINMLEELDNGFDAIYKRVRLELNENKAIYKKEIQLLQQLISKITDYSVKIQVLEENNKNKLQIYLTSKKKEIKTFKMSSQTVSSYYKNMSNQHQGQSYFLDKKN